jgi:Cu/Ag efflux pump CusA
MFGNVKDGLLVFSGIPFALTGASWLWLRDIPLSISAGRLHRCRGGGAQRLVMIAFIRNLREGRPR